MKNNVLIVGSGLGGLSTALRLTSRGYKVTIVEKSNKPGGRLNRIIKDGFTFDTGPTFFSMPYEFEELFDFCGIKAPFEYFEIDPLYAVNFKNNCETFYLYKDLNKLSEQFLSIESDFKNKLEKYLYNSQKVYNDTVDSVIKKNYNNIFDYLKALFSVNPVHLPLLFRTFWKEVSRYFDSNEARQIISLIAFFLGRTPFNTNGIYVLLSYIEFIYKGYYNVKGGMYKIVEGIVDELKKSGVDIYYNTEITDKIDENGKIKYLVDQYGNKWGADIFVINSDAAYFRGKVLKHKNFNESRLSRMNWTMGYLTIYLGLNIKLNNVDHHNYYIGNNFEKYSKNIMYNIYADKPYYYVNVISKYNQECAPEGHEALFFVCPVPNLLYKKSWEDKDIIVEEIINDFSERININIKDHIVSKTIYTPEDWQNNFNIFKGSGLGLAHTMNQIGFFRPKNYDERYKNVFYVGGSTIPGAGLPMVIISSKLVTDRILNLNR